MGPRSTAINLAVLIVPIIFGGIVAIDVRLVFVIFYLIGFWLFLKPKMSVVKQGIPNSFGTRHMNSAMKKSYYWGYGIMLCTAIFNLIIYFKLSN